MKVEIEQGKNGRWRWFMRDSQGKFKAMGNPYGFDSKQDAFDDAVDCLGSSVTAYDAEEFEYYAGHRDFEN